MATLEYALKLVKGRFMAESKTTVRVDDELLAQLQHAIIDRKTTQQEAIAEGLHLWMVGRPKYPADTEGLSASDKTLLMAFPRFLREAPEGSAWAVRKIIEGWLGRQPPPKPKR
jgi:hypothetical protein